jgi:alpha-galactosidase
MMVVGHVGWGKLRPTRLTPDEQYTHVSLWCLWSAPLLLGCPIEKLDAFTLSLLTNDEVLAVNQDALGIQAGKVAEAGFGEVLAKKLADGGLAVGLFNKGPMAGEVAVTWSALGVTGRRGVRDLWRQKDLGVFEDRFAAQVPAHGVVLVRVIPIEDGEHESRESRRAPIR